jgi:hypothetical protein
MRRKRRAVNYFACPSGIHGIHQGNELYTPTIARGVPGNLTLAQLLGCEHFSREAKITYGSQLFASGDV